MEPIFEHIYVEMLDGVRSALAYLVSEHEVWAV
jgi:hypothetical protein